MRYSRLLSLCRRFSNNVLASGIKEPAILQRIQCKSLPNIMWDSVFTHAKVKDSVDVRGNIQAFLPMLIKDLTSNPEFSDIPETLSWCQQVMEYNLTGGKMNRGLALIGAYSLLDPSAMEDQNMQTKLYAMACIVEMFQAYLLIIDDIMDQSTTRRGKPCWYRVNNLGVAAINDAVFLESLLYHLVAKYFQNEPSYTKCLNLFHEIGLRTTLGQMLDLMCISNDKPKLELFNEQRYSSIVKYKTSFYSFYLPVGLAMYMSNIDSHEVHARAKAILFKIGHLFQVQDDYLDCYGKFEDTGKEGTDIQEGKCTWLIVTALKKASEDQLLILKECYGSKNETNVSRVKAVYKELKLDEEYLKFEEQAGKEIEEMFVTDGWDIPISLFSNILHYIYKRRR